MHPYPDPIDFLAALASGEPTPGGGSAAALAGALGAALAAMVARLTLGRKRYADVEAQMQALIPQAEQLRSRLTQLIDEDAAAFDQVRAAYRLPKETAEQQTARQAAIQIALQAASRTPLETLAACLETLRLLEQVAAAGNASAVTDAAVGGLLAQAGLQSAALNVRVNLAGIDDPLFVAASQQSVAAALQEADTLQRRISASVEERMQS